jgi:ankyrin repeat protein
MLLAIKYEQPHIVPILLAGGATPTVDAQVRLVVAVNKGDLFALRQQLARGAKVNERTPTGETPLVEAILRHSTSRSSPTRRASRATTARPSSLSC